MAGIKRDVMQEMTDSFVAALEKGVGPWTKPWKGGAAFGLPVNATTGKNYRGVNVFALWLASQAKGYTADRWLTFNQAKKAGGSVRKGEKSTAVVFWRFFEKTDEKTGKDKKIPMARMYHVFNVAQCDGLPEKVMGVVAPSDALPESERLAHGERFFQKIGAKVNAGGAAFYAPATDEITMPSFGAFENGAAFYATLAHEHAHWTGHKDRLSRELATRFGSESYACEELIAEMASAFVGAHLGLPVEKLRHAEYLAHWVGVLKKDAKALTTFASAAQKAAEYLIEKAGEAPAPVKEDEGEDE